MTIRQTRDTLAPPSRPGASVAPTTIAGWRGSVGLAGGLLVLVTLAAASVWQSERNAAALGRAAETQALRTLVTSILIDAQNAETGQRGYLLTQNPDYLTPYNLARRRLPDEIAQLDSKRPGEPETGNLRNAIASKLVELQQTIDLATAGRVDDAVGLVRTNGGREDMIRIRQSVNAITGSLNGQVTREAEAIRRGGRILIVIDVVGLIMVIAMAALIWIGIRAYLAELAVARQATSAAYEALERNNERLDEAVRFRTADLVAANQEIQRFAYIVSHDLRAPLVNIMGFTSELEGATRVLASYTAEADIPGDVREAAVADIPEALRFIKASTSKMDRLINAILKLSREGNRLLTAEPLAMTDLLSVIVDSMGHQALAVEVIIGDLPDLVADRIAVEQVFGNLIDNALKYLHPERPGKIHLAGSVAGEMARYDVIDNGRGIERRDFERVFELFRRAGDQTVPGDGIGLAHVRALVRRMGGNIDCASTVGEGTTFTVHLPLIAQYGHDAQRSVC